MQRHPDPLPPESLSAALACYRVDELTALAKLLDRAVPGRKAEIIRAIEAGLTGAGLRTVFGRLDPVQQAAVAEAVHAFDGEYRPDAFRAKYGREPDLGATNYGTLTRPTLLRLFLHRAGYRAPLYIPEELRSALEVFVPTPPATELRSTTEPPAMYDRPVIRYDAKTGRAETAFEAEPLVFRETEAAARQELAAILALVDAGRLAVSDKKRQPTAAATRAVDSLLQEGDFYGEPGANRRAVQRGRASSRREQRPGGGVGPIRAFAWPMLLQAGGLARRWGSKLRLTPAGRAAMVGDPAPVLRELWRNWQYNELLDEFSRVEAIRGQSGAARRSMTSPSSRRDAIAEALAECPPGRWVAVDEFWRYLRGTGHDFDVAHDLWNLYIAEKEYGSLGYEGYGRWEILQGRYILALLFEYVATLGMIDVAYVHPAGARPDFYDNWGTDDLEFLSRYDGLAWFRLNALGAYCLHVSDEYVPLAPERRRGLTILPNLEVAALEVASVPPGDRLLLDRFAEPVSDRVWRLDRERILAAVEDGHTVSALRDLLEAKSDAGLPEPVARFLADIEDRAASIRDAGAARLIDCGSAELAARIAAEPALRRICMTAGQRYVAVRAGKEAAFRKALRKIGYVLPGPGTP